MLQLSIVLWQKTGHAVRAIGRLSSMAMMAGVSAKKGSPTEGRNTERRHGGFLVKGMGGVLGQSILVLGDSLTIRWFGYWAMLPNAVVHQLKGRGAGCRHKVEILHITGVGVKDPYFSPFKLLPCAMVKVT